MPATSQALANAVDSTATSSNTAETENETVRRSLPVELSITFHRYLCWLVQLQASIDTVCHDAYTLDRLTLQSVLPLRQRSSPPTAAQTGLKAAVYELLVGAAERQNQELLYTFQQHRAWKLIGGVRERPVGDKKAWPFSQFSPSSSHVATPEASLFVSPAITHSNEPPCPCCVFIAQQRASSGKRRSHSSSSSSGSDGNVDSNESGIVLHRHHSEGQASCKNSRRRPTRHLNRKNDVHVTTTPSGGAVSSAGSTPANPYGSPRLSPARALTPVVSASFPTRLKDSVRTGSGVATAQTSTLTTEPVARASRASSSLSDTPGLPDQSDYTDAANSYLVGQLPDTAQMVAVQPLLLPLSAVKPLRPLSASIGTKGEEGRENKENSESGSSLNNGRASTVVASALLSPPSKPPLLPLVPVSPDTQLHRTLHPFWSHVAPEDVQRCSLCGGQLLLMSTWHALYLLQLLTMLSAAPSMAAPLPLPPPSVLKIQPVEGLFLLFQTVQRCFVAGVALSSAVCVQSTSNSAHLQRQENGGDNTLDSDNGSGNEVLFGIPSFSSSVTGAATQAPSALDVLRGGHGGDTSVMVLQHRQQQQQNKEDRLLSVLTASIFRVVDVVGRIAAPLLWLLKGKEEVSVLSATTPAQGGLLTQLRGDALALRFRVFHAAFLVLVVQDGTSRGAAALADSATEILNLIKKLKGAQHRTSHDTTEEGLSDDTYLVMARALTLLAKRRPVSAASSYAVSGNEVNTDSSDDVTVLNDDLEALCCVVVLLTVFVDLVRAKEENSDPPSSVSSSSIWLSSSATHALDALVYPTLVELQNSSCGNCSAQARPLLALWWLIRVETVRQSVVAFARNPQSSTTIHVLEQEVDLKEEDGAATTDTASTDAAVVVLHWTAWLKEASRAAVRASNAAGEFLGLTLSTSSSILGATLPLLSLPSREMKLRWKLPIDVSSAETTQAGVEVAPLPLAWLRMWLLLCPPLFHISPTDVLTLRHTLQEQHQSEKKPEIARAGTAAAALPANGKQYTLTSGTRQESIEFTRKEQQPAGQMPQKPGPKTRDSIKGRSRLSMDCSADGNMAETLRCMNDVSPVKPAEATPGVAEEKKSIPTEKCSGGKNGSNTGDDGTAHHLSDVETLQQCLQVSTESVYFWSRWCQLFLPSPALPLQQDASGKPDSQEKTALPSSTPQSFFVTAAVSDAVAVLQDPSLAWTASSLQSNVLQAAGGAHPAVESMVAPPVSGTQLVDSLRGTFPLFNASDVIKALTAQARLFLPTGTHVGTGSVGLPSNVSALFAPYSFVAALAPLRDVVVKFQGNAPSFASNFPSRNASPTARKEEMGGATPPSIGTPHNSTQATAVTAVNAACTSFSSPLQFLSPTYARAASLSIHAEKEGTAVRSATTAAATIITYRSTKANNNNVSHQEQQQQLTRAGTKRQTLLVARTLSRRAVDGRRKSPTPLSAVEPESPMETVPAAAETVVSVSPTVVLPSTPPT